MWHAETTTSSRAEGDFPLSDYPDRAPAEGYIDPVNEAEGALFRERFVNHRVSDWLLGADFHISVENQAPELGVEYRVDVRALCDFSCTPRPGDAFFGLPAGDDYYEAFDFLGERPGVDLGFPMSTRTSGVARGIVCDTSPYNHYVEDQGDTDPLNDLDGDPCNDYLESWTGGDIDVVSVTGFGHGMVDGALVTNDDDCTGVLRIEWSGANAPTVAFRTTAITVSTGVTGWVDEAPWTYDASFDTSAYMTSDFYLHVSNPPASYAKDGFQNPPGTEYFSTRRGDNFIELVEGPDLIIAPSNSVVVDAALANNAGEPGTPWVASYFCDED